jgi:hypothetical protein
MLYYMGLGLGVLAAVLAASICLAHLCLLFEFVQVVFNLGRRTAMRSSRIGCTVQNGGRGLSHDHGRRDLENLPVARVPLAVPSRAFRRVHSRSWYDTLTR